MIRKYETEWDEGEVPNYWSVNHCLLLAERDLWATRFNMAKTARRLAESVINEIEKWDYSPNQLADAKEELQHWEKALVVIEKKYNAAVNAVKNHDKE